MKKTYKVSYCLNLNGSWPSVLEFGLRDANGLDYGGIRTWPNSREERLPRGFPSPHHEQFITAELAMWRGKLRIKAGRMATAEDIAEFEAERRAVRQARELSELIPAAPSAARRSTAL